ncbi:probable inactive receptor kinase At1g48480 [Zingiber officinale]|uniref:probable inactive receptor kinase At1g48480 n=1 Tax=Zingiber officinale TaxID=94328 RepID=UPI001C4D0821|nr:probable inactive receptor kinase At1g48480 [Zingiber officinale]
MSRSEYGHLPHMASRLLLRLVAGALLLLVGLPGGTPDLASDTAALVALRDAIGRSALPTWNSSVPTCSWPGVTCVFGRVDELRLPGVGLIGQIPAAVGNLTALHTLSLRFNALSGPLPGELARLVELRNLYLQDNRLSGEIPLFLASMKSLVRLNLAGNQFTGRIPSELNNLTRLGTLYLESNRLSGEIPPLDIPSLVQFNVSYNQLNGSIPAGLRSQPKNAFLDTSLCGGPLGLCPGEIAPSPSAEGASGNNAGGGVFPESGKKKKLSGGAIAGIAIGAAAFVLLLLVALILLCRGRIGAAASGTKPMETAELAEERDKGPGDGRANTNGAAVTSTAVTAAAKSSSASSGGPGVKKLVFFGSRRTTPAFDLEDLLRASAEVLGKGTFGTTYKAVLESGEAVAVKRLKDVNLPEAEFKERIEAIGAMDHLNLVSLTAYYFSADEKLLVYEFMSTGSLSALMHGDKGSGQAALNWETRTGIALAAARGLQHIHSASPSTSHGNVKSSNVLLTESYEARLSDHGLALLAAGSTSPALRAAGYRAPEVTDPRKVSQKADVYSFGVLLLELLTGKAAAQAVLNEEGVDLPRWVQSVVGEAWTADVFDAELLRWQNAEEEEEMVRLLQLAMDCVAHYPDKRPSMSEVIARIRSIRSKS